MKYESIFFKNYKGSIYLTLLKIRGKFVYQQ